MEDFNSIGGSIFLRFGYKLQGIFFFFFFGCNHIACIAYFSLLYLQYGCMKLHIKLIN